MSEIHDEVHQVLSNQDEIQFEELPSEDSSPLNQPVVEKQEQEQEQPVSTQEQSDVSQEEPESENDSSSEEQQEQYEAEEVDVAPAQSLDEHYSVAELMYSDEDFELPNGHAKQAADTILGSTADVLPGGGVHLGTIRKQTECDDLHEH